MMKLVIAEKPSVGMAYASVLGAKKRMEGYLEGNGYIVSWCFGHLAELASAEAYDEKYAKWRCEDLPIVPNPWVVKITHSKKKQFDLLRELMRQEDVSEVINGCDAGREGELIFRYVYEQAGCKKPMKRLWLSSMEDEAIRDGFRNLRPGADYDRLYAAALCRAKADWLVGINATRLFSVLYHRTLNVGRVVSPTLALLVQRDAEISAFKPEPYYTVDLTLPAFSAVSEKFREKSEAERICAACANAPARVIGVEAKEKSEKAPALYDLTTLQREANRALGYPDLPDDPSSKVNTCVGNIFRIWKEGQADKLTQLVFCDLSTPKVETAKRVAKTAGGKLDSPELHAVESQLIRDGIGMEAPFSIYDDIRSKLVAMGIPREQIAFIHEANTEARKKELFAKVRSGQVRVLMGSTFKMGAGMNVQDRLIALHDLDAPWRPGDLEQRSGRIIRQGNRNKEVHIYRYVTEGTFDAYLWVRHEVA